MALKAKREKGLSIVKVVVEWLLVFALLVVRYLGVSYCSTKTYWHCGISYNSDYAEFWSIEEWNCAYLSRQNTHISFFIFKFDVFRSMKYVRIPNNFHNFDNILHEMVEFIWITNDNI